ncbi:unnamed protein product [Effrenium voratum]|nr:unnamed protein product [Effrenium voratum]
MVLKPSLDELLRPRPVSLLGLGCASRGQVSAVSEAKTFEGNCDASVLSAQIICSLYSPAPRIRRPASGKRLEGGGGMDSRWTKALCIAGGAAAAAGVLWYVFREDEEEAAAEAGLAAAGGQKFCVTDPSGACIGIRKEPDVSSARTGLQLMPGEVFDVSEVLEAPDGQMYLKLADGRGWAFTRSSRDGRLLCQRVSDEEAEHMAGSQPSMQRMMAEVNALLERQPELREQVLASPELQAMLANPDAMRSAAQQNPFVASAMQSNPGVQEWMADGADPEALAQAMRSKAG